MSNQQTLQLLQAELQENLPDSGDIISRDAKFPDAPNKIKVAVGMRRSGKTYFIYQSLLLQLHHGIPFSRLLYLNFEDDRLLPLDASKLAGMLEAFYTLHPENHDLKCYFYLDEIQNVPGWPNVIRRFHDTKNIEIYLTGSSAKLLSKEIATTLRGRSIATEIWPYSFNEFLKANNIIINRNLSGKKNQDQLMQAFTLYLAKGGFPEVTHYAPDLRQQVLQDYVDIVIYRDIIERYGISQPSIIKYMITSLMHNVAKPFSVNKFYNDIKSQGYKITKDSLYEYQAYIEDAYLQFSVPLYAQSIRKSQANPKKIYAIDTGLIHAFTLEPDINYGNLFENIIFLDLRRQGYHVHYYLTADRREVDFLVQDRKGNKHLLQVTWEMDDPETRQRVISALDMAKNELNIDGHIITLDAYLRDGINLFV